MRSWSRRATGGQSCRPPPGTASVSEAESFRDADHELTDQPMPARVSPASPAESKPPEVKLPAVEAEHWSEIEWLVFQVLPDNLENMDKMLEQFSGRGEELIVTLTLCAANKRRRASPSGRTSTSGSGREGSGGVAVAESGCS